MICRNCGESFNKKGGEKECGTFCKIRARIKEINGCWEWQTMICKRSGYGRTRHNGILMTAHRISYIHFKGEIPPGKLVLHTCDNKKCVNPEHLFTGTHKENTHDMMKKGRMASFKGEGNSSAILNEKKVLEIRNLHSQGKKIKEIAEIFGIKYFTCLDVINRRNWNHI